MKIFTKSNTINDVTNNTTLELYQKNALPEFQFLIVSDEGKILNEDVNIQYPQGKYLPTFSNTIELKWDSEQMLYAVLRTQAEIEIAQAEINNAQWITVRTQRNQLLFDCDWTQLPDAPLSSEDKTTWQIYRQVLRDITDNFTNPFEVVFPIKPQ